MAFVFRSNKQSLAAKRAVLEHLQEHNDAPLSGLAKALLMVLIDDDRKCCITGTASLVGLAKHSYSNAFEVIEHSKNKFCGSVNRAMLCTELLNLRKGKFSTTELLLWRAIQATEKDNRSAIDVELVSYIHEYLSVFHGEEISFTDGDEVSFTVGRAREPQPEPEPEPEPQPEPQPEEQKEAKAQVRVFLDDGDDNEEFVPTIDLAAALPSPALLPKTKKNKLESKPPTPRAEPAPMFAPQRRVFSQASMKARRK